MGDEININGTIYVPKGKEIPMAQDTEGLKFCVIRCSAAGVHAGFVKCSEQDQVCLLQSRRLWRWHARTLSGLALEGPDDAERCKFAPTIPEIYLHGVCEVIPCTDSAMEKILAVQEWEND